MTFGNAYIFASSANIQFEDHIEMLKYAYNSITVSGRLEDGLNLVCSQKRMVAFDYQLATQQGMYSYSIFFHDNKQFV